jgi:ferredoxin-NADP reductase
MLLCVRSITYLAQRINGYELVDPEKCDLPAFTAGAHVSVRAARGPVRDFSLWNDPAERARYCIAVLREPEGQGSREWHERVRAGDVVEASDPRNNFPLVPEAEHHLLIAGGIGITPIRALLEELPADLVVVYRVVSEDEALFLDELERLAPTLHLVAGDHREERHAGLLSPSHLRQLVPDLAERDVFVCGPPAFTDLTRRNLRAAGVPRRRIHAERFAL